MADLYYIEEDYYNPSLGYFVYTADAAAAPSSNFTLGCDATVVGAATEANAALVSTYTVLAIATRIQEANAALASTATTSATATVGKETSVSLTSSATVSTTATRIQEGTASFTSAFSPSLTVEVFKNSFAVLDSPAVLTVTPSVNRSITQALDNIATLNAMAARTRDLASTLDSTSTLTTSLTALKTSSANLTSTATLSADAQNVQLASASLVSAFSVGTTKYVGVGRPRNIGFTSPSFSSSIKKFGSHSLTKNGAGITRQYDTGLIPGPSRSWAFEGWVYPRVNEGTAREVFGIGENRLVDRFFMSYLLSGGLEVEVYNSAGTKIFSGGAALANNTWHHILIVKNSSAWSLFIDGTRTHTSTSNLTATYYNPGASAFLRIGDGWTNSTLTPYYDDVSFHIGTTLGFDPTASSITVPTSARVNDPDTTRVLLHFDNDLLDDITFTALASASLSSTVSLSATASETQSLSANLSAVSTVTASGISTRSIASDLTSTATLSATATRVLEAVAALSSTATQSVTATRIVSTAQADLSTQASLTCAISVTRDSVSALSSSTNQTIDYTRTRSAASAFTSAFSPTLIITAQRAGVALLESVTTLSAEAAKTTGVSSDLNSMATVVINAGRLIALSSSMTSESTLAIDYLHLVGVSASLASESSTSTAATRTRSVASAMSCASALTAESSRTRNISSDLTSSSTLSATATRIQPGSSALASTAELTNTTVKTANGSVALSTVATQSVTAVKTATVVANFAAIATELVVAFKNATGTITMESSVTLTMSIGRIQQLDRNRNFGVISGGGTSSIPRLGPLSGLPFHGLGWNEPGLVVSLWARRKTTNTFNVLWTYDNPPPADSAIQAFVIDNNNVRLRNYYDSDEPGATWPNQAPVDTEWHNYVLQCSRQYGYWKLWIDGVYQGERLHQAYFTAEWNNSGYIRFGSGVNRSAGLQYDETETDDSNLDFAQIWVGLFPTNYIQDPGGNYYLASPLFNPLEFYNGGYVELGDTGRGEFNQLPAPYIYNRLSGAYTYTYPPGGSPNNISVPAAESALEVPSAQVSTRLTAEGATVLILSGNLVSTATLTAQTNNLANASSQMSATATETATASITRTTTATLAVTVTQSSAISRTRSVSSNFESIFTEMVVIGKLSADISLLGTSFTLQVEGTKIEPIRTGAELISQSTLSATGIAFTGISAQLTSQTLLVADITVKPPVRIEADLTSVVTLTATIGSIEQFAVLTVSSGTLVCVNTRLKIYSSQPSSQFTATSTARRLVALNAALNCQGFVITVGEVIAIDPFTTYLVPQETRAYYILEEQREYLVPQETRVNIIQGYQS